MSLRQQYMRERGLVDACDMSDVAASQALFAKLTFCATQRRLVERYVEHHRAKPRREENELLTSPSQCEELAEEELSLMGTTPHLDDYEERTGELR